MYIAPCLRGTSDKKEITNLCDEFLHIDETPEANIIMCCSGNNCIRKSVTCIAILSKESYEIYSAIYANKNIPNEAAIHAEIFLINDIKLRKHLTHDATLTLYLTFQPCHFSGGHYKTSCFSCTESILQFYLKHLKPKNIKLVIKFGYIYRAHWTNSEEKYTQRINNAIEGLYILLINNIQLQPIDECDHKILYRFCSEQIKKDWDCGVFDELIQKRKQLTIFLKNFLQNLNLNTCIVCT